jgi:pseudomonalisin
MHLKHARLFLLLLVSTLSATMALAAPGVATHKRVVNDNDTVTVAGNVHQGARADRDAGPADPNLRLDKMVLVLTPRADAAERPDQLIARLHDPASPDYHHWLTPEEYGQRFGISDSDLHAVTSWLERQGFTVDEVTAGRGSINFSGKVADVERAFKTPIRNYRDDDGTIHHANAVDPQVPRALADIVRGVVSLHNFPRHPMNVGFHRVPYYTSGTSHYIAPADFVKIYNVQPLYTAGINGTGQTIAIVGRTDIALADVQYFRSFFGLPANDPVFVHNGTDPGDLGSGEEGEADLDVEWSGAVAPSATIKFVISKSTTSTDGVDLSAQYIVNNNVAKIMSTSFGQCESSMGTSENTFYNNLWSQAASQGITPFVSSGDSGAAGCNGGSDTTGSGAAVSGLASTPFNVAVGGTQFNDTANPAAYWSATNNATDHSSALSYIPEIAWNESGNVSGGSGLWASSGGQSTVYAKPSWQVCVGVPSTNARFVPDVALTAAGHDGYLVIQGHTSTVTGLGAVGGTSASSPSFASVMALVNQKTAQSWGNANTKFYSLANAQYTGAPGAATIFHDTTSGNNSVPGVTGFNCGTGYDAVTGVGSVDVSSLVNNFTGTPTPDFAISAASSSVSVVQGFNGTSTITTTVSGGFNAAVALSATGAPAGTTVSFSPASIAAPGSGSSTMTMTVGASTVTGTYSITVTGTSGSTNHSTTVSLTVTPAATPDFAISAAPTSVSVVQGANGTSTVTTTISGGFNSAVALSATGAPTGTTVTFAPTSIAAPGNGTSTMTMAVGASTVTGNYTITITGTGGTKTHTATVTLTVTAPSNGALANGTFETGTLSGWTTTGTAAVNTASKHSGTYGAQLGSTAPSTDSTLAQTFTLPSNASTLSFWYANTCPDTLTYDWATATLKDNVTGTTTTVLAKTCTTTALWSQVSANVAANAGHSMTLTITNHDDNYPGDPTFTYVDDVVVATSTPDTTPPTTSITAPANGATVSGTTSVTASASDNVGVTKVEFYLDGTLASTDTTSPYSWSWDTTTATNASHSLVTKAYDAAGNIGTSTTVTVTVSNSTVTQLLGNPGFENGSTSPAPWTVTPAVVDSSTSEPSHSGTWKAWMDGYGTAHTDSILQTVTIPAGKTSATLTFWLHIDTAETSTTLKNDTLNVQIRNSSGVVLATLATYSNLDKNTGYAQKSFNLNAYIGQTIQVYLVGVENSSLQTSFVVDDFALNVQ